MSASGPVTRALMAAVTAVTAVWFVVVVAWPDAPFAITFDDAWYYLGIARNISDGAGSTFDGINPTNGYHPLWMLVCVLAFVVGLDDLVAARVLLALQVLLYGASLAIGVQIVGQFTKSWPSVKKPREPATRAGSVLLAVTFAVVAGNPFVVKTFANGLESGLVVIFLALILRLGVRADGKLLRGLDRPQRLQLSGLLALAFLARTDAAILLALLGVWAAVEWLRIQPRPTRELLEIFVVPAVVAVAYLTYNQVVFGSPVQISGIVKRADPGVGNSIGFLVFLAGAAAIQRHAFRRIHDDASASNKARFPRAGAFVLRTSWFAGFCVLLVGYYLTLQTQIWLWYFGPVVLYGLILLPLATADFANEAFRTAGKVAPHRALLPVWLILGIPLLAAFMITGAQFADPNLRSIQVANADAGQWIRANLPEDARLASWDAGAVGFFSHRSVINLDGVVNSREYYDATQAGPGPIRDFLRCRDLRYIVNHGGGDTEHDADIQAFIRVIYGEETERGARVIHTQPFLYSGTTTGSGGADNPGLRAMAVRVYELPVNDATGNAGCPGL